MSNITAGAMRAAEAVGPDHWNDLTECARIIDRWTGAQDLLDVIKACAQHPNFAGCLPELVERVNAVINRES